MPRSPQYSPALLLRSVDYRDSDRIVTLLTREYGKVSALARGARKSRRRYGGALQPYVLLNAALHRGRGELWILESVTVLNAHHNIVKNFGRITAGGEMLALLRRMVPDAEPDAQLFDTAVQLLEALNGEGPTQSTAVAFEARLLALIGIAPSLQSCSSCGKQPAPAQNAFFDAVRGSIVCRACGGGQYRLSAQSRSLLQRAMTPQWQPAEGWQEEAIAEIRTALNAIVLQQFGERFSREHARPAAT